MREFEERGLGFWVVLSVVIFLILAAIPRIELWLEIGISIIPVVTKIVVSYIFDVFAVVPEQIYTTQKTEIEKLREKDSLVRVVLDAEKYSFPFPNTKVVGIKITNREKHELTDIYLELTDLKQTQFYAPGDYSSNIVRLDGINSRFSLGGDLKIGAESEMIIRLGEIKRNKFLLLLEIPYNPNREYDKQNGVHMSSPIWELAFELHGKIQGKSFVREMFTTQIQAIMGTKKPDWGIQNITTLEIGEIKHVK